ncbi:universal stress protein [Pedobacter sp. ASV1-7]|uniref:universal stress protein n=1 Tax=Pedobacter sp. ASV1-7 TaxID=3145237 RepID=UPI0032E8F7F5
METFSVMFRAGNLNLNAIVTEHSHHQKFKVELVTKESDPILLDRSPKGDWKIMQPGSRNFSNKDFEELEWAIEKKLMERYSVKNMLVLTDYSNEASNAAKYATELAQQLNTQKIFLYHSYESIALPATSFAPISGFPMESHDSSLKNINKLKSELEETDALKAEIEVRTDERELIYGVNTLVQQLYIGLVVAGITGKNTLERVLIGSNTLSLVKECLAPLLIIPSVARFEPIKTIVFACDLKRVSEATPVLAIKTFLQSLGAKLLILNVDSEGKHFTTDTLKEMSQLHEFWDEHEPEYHYIDHSDTAEGIMGFAKEKGAQLVITVPKLYGFLESLFHSSLTRKLTFNSYLPLLLFREDV